MDTKFPAGIEKTRMFGYFDASVRGLPENLVPPEYMGIGDLHLDRTSKGAAF